MTLSVRAFGDDPRSLLNNSDQLVGIDTETGGLDWTDPLLGVSLAWRDGEGTMRSCYFHLERDQLDLFASSHEEIDISLLQEITNKHTMCFHMLAFDYRTLMKHLGITPITKSYDTTHLAKSVQWVDSFSLENLHKDILGRPVPPHIKEIKKRRKTLQKLDSETRAEYGRFDAEATLEMVERILPKYTSMCGSIADIDMRVAEIAMYMMYRGLPVDTEWAMTKKNEWQKRMLEITKSLHDEGGITNLDSPQQVANFLFNKEGLQPISFTASNQPSTKKADLEKLEGSTPHIRDILDFRELSKAIGSWIDPVLSMAAWDGRARSILNPFGTRSFRMSSENINLQAVPLHDRGAAFGGLLPLFSIDDPDRMLLAIDWSQIEVRFSGMLASESSLAKVFSQGEDPYIETSKLLWDVADRRQDAKHAVLSSLYEIGPTTYAQRYDTTVDYAREILGSFRRQFPNIKKASRYWEKFAAENGYVPIPVMGKVRRRYFAPGDNYWKAFNQIVQTSVAEALDLAMIEIERVLPGRLLLQIHDSVVMEITKNEEEEVKSTVQEIMRNVVPEWMLQRTTPQIQVLTDVEYWNKQ